jgi:outer membrane lipoprotein-sorting protein
MKKILLVVALCLILITITACGETADGMDNIESEEEAAQALEDVSEDLEDISDSLEEINEDLG